MKTLPPLPKRVASILGPLAVLVVVDLKDKDGSDIFGAWDPFAREISVRAGMHPISLWSTLWHERTHADISDIGIVISTDQEEAICNAIAAARVHEMLNSLP